jgi:DNA-binding LacI/PurR family transcriptional regulator/transposase
MTTIRQLAQFAGVSPTTVFKVLHHTGNIAPETRQRILDLAALYQYRTPVAPAGARPRLIGCIVPATGWTHQLISELSARAFAEGYSLVILETHSQLVHAMKALHVMAEVGVRGIVIHSGTYDPIPRSAIWELWSRDIPVIARDVTPMEIPVDRVSTDERLLADLAVQHLFDLGHRSIGFIAHLAKGFHRGRPCAIRQALRQHGIPLEHSIDLDACCVGPDRYDLETQLVALMHAPHCPTAIIAESDDIAALTLRAAIQCGFCLPRDLSIIATGSWNKVSRYVIPTLTTIEQDYDGEAHEIATLLFQRLAEGTNPADCAPKTILIPPKQLLPGNSCAPPGTKAMSGNSYSRTSCSAALSNTRSTVHPCDLTDAEWAILEPLLPHDRAQGRGRRREINLRQVLNALRYRLLAQCSWRGLPADWGLPWKTVHDYYRRFQHDGTWTKIYPHLARPITPTE